MISSACYKVRAISDLKDMIKQSEALFGGNNAFLLKDKDEVYKGKSYSEFKSDLDALGTSLIDLGLKDKFIAVIGENRYEWCLTYLSVVNGVGVIVPLDKELSVSEIEELINKSSVSAVVFSGKYKESITEISHKCESLKYLINMDEEESTEALTLASLIERGGRLIKGGDSSYLDAEIDSDKMSILLFTSGTTGNSKGVMLSHKNICSNITSVSRTVYVGPSDSVVSILPLHHTYECSLGFLTMIYSGATISFTEGLKYIAKNLKELKPSVLVTVPLLLENMYRKVWEQASKHKFMKFKLIFGLTISALLLKLFKLDIRKKIFKPIHENFGGRLRLIITGAAAIDPKISKWFRKIGIMVLQGYGLTECSPLVTGNRDKEFIDSSVGLPIPDVEVKIDNPNHEGVGEVLVKGPNVMLGYFDNDDSTANCFRDGWFCTGDMGCFDKRGFLYLTGRYKNVIVTKNGKKIFPEEIEMLLNKSPFVKEAVVLGEADEKSGDTIISAQVFPNYEAIKEKFKAISLTPEAIKKQIENVIKNVNNGVPIYKKIRNFHIREVEFVKTTTNKIKRHLAAEKHVEDQKM